ncbi:MAG: hypothetical protein K9H65_02620 [Bacteroidales bacterium]|nr:hypothetical protein [Bacteroidales bacterium]
MEKEKIIKYIENPHELNEYSFSELRAVLKKYPYFQTAHQLLLLNLKNINDPRFKEFLKYSAVFIKDREKFYRLLNDLSAIEDRVKSKGEGTDKADVETNESEKKHPVKTKRASGDSIDSGEEGELKKEKPKKDKDFSTAYLKQRISDALSVQKEDSHKKEDLPDDSGDFFILDKASQVEEKMSRKLKEKYEKEIREKEGKDADKESSGERDSFELDSTKKEERQKSQSNRSPGNLSGEYFTEKDYRETIQDKKHNEDLIDKFIKQSPELKNVHPPGNRVREEDISKYSVTEDEEMLSEKLANIYIKQRYYDKAISTYEKLSLKYPEKSDYFAKQIEILRNIINEQQK